jgi:hypothetical protein
LDWQPGAVVSGDGRGALTVNEHYNKQLCSMECEAATPVH